MMATPTTTATQDTSEAELNQINLHLKQQPWYQQFFKERGLNPNKVHLSSDQQQALTQLAAQNGYALGDRMKVDAAGNFNQKGGFAGLPAWGKALVAGAPIAGAMLIPGVGPAVLNGATHALGSTAHAITGAV